MLTTRKIAECKVAVYVVANSLNERPSLPHIAKFGPGEVHETIRLAIPAAKEIDERFDRELFQSLLLSIRRYGVGLAAVADQKIREKSKPAPWGVYDVANIAETIAIAVGRDRGIQVQKIRRHQVLEARRMHAEHRNHWR